MIEKATSPANIQAMLQTLRSHQTQLEVPKFGSQALGGASTVGQPAFTDLVKGAVAQVNQTQGEARGLQTAFERGEPVALTDVVLGMQKSSLAFEATLQVRNKVLKAYEDVLNMPV